VRNSFDRRVVPERLLDFIRRFLSTEELRRFRDQLAQRMKRAAIP